MLITCPKCGTKARIATSRTISAETRELYCQCLNLNCGKIMVSHVCFSHFVEHTGQKPNPDLQPELCKDLDQMDIFDEIQKTQENDLEGSLDRPPRTPLTSIQTNTCV